MTQTPNPTPDERRQAVCAAVASATGLIRYAARFTRSIEDAEDAYQRAMEIALTRAPVVEHERFMAWLRTVLRNEALAQAARRRREGPAPIEDAADAAARQADGGAGPDARAEWRHRYFSLQDALAALTEAQRVCVILQAGGASYRAIEDITGFSRRKVERSILEGRAALAAWETRIESGDACGRLRPVLERVASGEADSRERRRLSRHLRHCGACRSLLRDRRNSNEWLAALAPVALLAGVVDTAPPDPIPVLSWIDRLSAGATVRMGNLVQAALEAPGSMAAKVGAGAAAAVVAAGAGLPVVSEIARTTPQRDGASPAAVAEARPAPAPPPAVTSPPSSGAPPETPRDATAPEAEPAPVAIPATRLAPLTDARLLGRIARRASAPPPGRADAPPQRGATSAGVRRSAAPSPSPPPTGRAPAGPSADVAGPRGIAIGPGGP